MMNFNKKVFTVLILVLVLALAGSGCVSQGEGAEEGEHVEGADEEASNIWANPVTPWNPVPTEPTIDSTAYIHPQASVIGDATIGARVMVSPFASVRSDEGMPIFVGDECNIQDGAVLHALETIDEEGEPVESHIIEVNGEEYAVYVGERVSIAHQAQIHGPAYVGNDTFVGMQALVFNAKVGNDCVLEPTSAVIGVTVPDGRYVSAGTVVTSQAKADALPEITADYGYKHTNEAVVYVNVHLADGYNEM
jgi:carbonic anhydrase/acetyltransferase-like protein (isoleucine patch superfamily)